MMVFLLACNNLIEYQSMFEGPEHSTVFYPPLESPLAEPIAFVSNLHSGQILPLDLKHESPFSDQYAAPFLRPRGVATGAARQLGPIHAYAPSTDRIHLFAIDYRYEQLIMAPYLEGMLPEPQVITPSHTAPSFQDNDSSGDSVSVNSVTLRTGKTTTETWTLNYYSGRWKGEGSRSGNQEATGVDRYKSDRGEIELQINGEPTEGDQIVFQTDSGIQEWDLGGTPLQMSKYDEHTLLINVWDDNIEQSAIIAFDMLNLEEIGRWYGPAGTQLYSMTVNGDTVYLGASRTPLLIQLEVNALDLSDATERIIEAPSPIQSLVYVEDEDYAHLAVAGAGDSRLYMFDVAEDSWLDLHPFSESLGIPLYSPIVGMSPSRERVPLQTVSQWGARESEKVIVITTFEGGIMMADARSGCMATFKSGGYAGASDDPSSQTIEFEDSGPLSDPAMLLDPATGGAITTPWCGGLLRAETWTARYDGIEGSFEIEGSKSGVQNNRAYLDERYISDEGAISFSIVSGAYPPTDGDRYIFSTNSGQLRISEVLTASGGTEFLELPGPPKVFDYWAGPRGGGWDEYRQRSFALVPIINSNIVVRVRLDNYSVEAVWN